MDMAVSKNEIVAFPDSEQSQQVWQQLKQVIANSSGFKRWQTTRKLEPVGATNDDRNVTDDLVRCYLRETLETLAY
ncbi:hypothetical protein Pse7367_2183 [Thalassoporum mexicanum PCC 7367]|uniref:hypothetical protein n=1 Tax=Thalassoporum mexicanum TaxID=3457544 RepID=UPI00029FF7BD|nr:hypothetical protein [Pseudanabaena sp. PCC 7367]AFY70447.1 hypothetical protein Pse7367_2183 [Pseudanabaena sp. PCC 7367]